jgi:hypothetical protein
MKIFSEKRQVSRASARNCFLINQFATPGLGSLMAGRILSGFGQLLMAFGGFALVGAWTLMIMKQTYELAFSDSPHKSYAWLGELGGAVFIAAWLWSLFTSLSLLRAAKRFEEEGAKNPPPIIQ